MPSLKEILKDKEKIKSLCEKFGFTNVRVYCDPSTPVLQLVVSEDSTDEQYQAGLEAILLEELNCMLSVMVDSQIDSVYLTDLLNNSASIDNTEALKEKFGNELNKVDIEIFSKDKKDCNFYRALDLANEVLGRERISSLNNSSTLFTKTNLPPYERLTKLLGFRFKADPETSDPTKLNEHINNAILSNDTERLIASLEHAKRLVLYTGVPGIIQYVNVTCRLLDNREDSFKQQAFNALVHLNMAEMLLTTDEQAKQLVVDVLKDSNILSADYWNQKKDVIIGLAHLELRKQEARDAAHRILQRLEPPLKKQHLR